MLYIAANGFSWRGPRNDSVGRLRQKTLRSRGKFWSGSYAKFKSEIPLWWLPSEGEPAQPYNCAPSLRATLFAFTLSVPRPPDSLDTIVDARISLNFTTDHVSTIPQLNPCRRSFLKWPSSFCRTPAWIRLCKSGLLPLKSGLAQSTLRSYRWG